MNPSFVPEELPAPQGPSRRRRLASLLWRGARGLPGVLVIDVADLIPGRRAARRLRVEDGLSPWARAARGLAYRLMFLPVLIVLTVLGLVYGVTHPPPALGGPDPVCQGIYYDPVVLRASDGVRIEAWLAPVVDARRILAEKERALHRAHPAVVLVHDFGMSRQQMLPLVRPLHDAGFVVVVLNSRGCGGSGAAACTFGVNEALDVVAAVEMLRRRPFVNPQKIALVGVGAGATAAKLAAERDPGVAAVVLDSPVHRFDDALSRRLELGSPALRWLVPPCRWAFEIAYGADTDSAGLDPFPKKLEGRPVLLFGDQPAGGAQYRRVSQVVDFLKAHLVKTKKGAPRAG